ncbi:MAG: erythromycin esterase family protein [Planctomycetes bacterium]|nr:erythromycin esterase family protein [Planctomycetota bacterium]
MRRRTSSDSAAGPGLVDEVRKLSHPLASAGDLDPLMTRIGEARVVLLGEASHGTREFYTWRTAITRRLIEEKGFNFVAVEGDWPDCYRVNRFVKGYPGSDPSAEIALSTFRRWPTWMWANREVQELVGWMEWFNQGRPEDDKIGFYGLDVYSLWDSLRSVMRYLKERGDPGALLAARRAVRCFEPWGEDAQEYARHTVLVPDGCREPVVGLLRTLRARVAQSDTDVTGPAGIEDSGRAGRERDAFFVAEQNALVVKNAEAYYRAMVLSDESSWNVRDRHMAETLERLLAFTAPGARAVVWEHNTHIGDARFTDMAAGGEVNVGQLARERYGENGTVLVGFGTHRGTVIAGREWGEPWERMQVPPGRPESWEDVLHRASGGENRLLVFPEQTSSSALSEWRGHRAIGVVYRPQYEQYGNYVPTVLPRRYDAFLYIDETSGVRPLFPATHDLEADEEAPETYPTGA